MRLQWNKLFFIYAHYLQLINSQGAQEFQMMTLMWTLSQLLMIDIAFNLTVS